MNAYISLEHRFARLSALGDASGILGWDQQTTMPLGAAGRRSEQLATLAVLSHEILIAPETADLLDAAEQGATGLKTWQQANLREMRRTHAHATALPADLVEARSKAASRCEIAWRQARADADFAAIAPLLSEVLTLEREAGVAKGAALGLSPYDALLDGYDPGMRQARIDPLFADLRAEFPELLAQVLARQAAQGPALPLDGPFPADVQRAIGLRLMDVVGFDATRGRLDISAHPFCGGATDDVRITTRYDEADFSTALMGVLHESGHALYEQGRPRDWLSQPVGSARGMTLHESQSLIMEMQACRSPAFVAYLAPILREAFGRSGPAWEAANLARAYTHVEPGFIRVDADEVTYPAHILLRYGLETALIASDMKVADIPAAWNDGMRQLLGLDVPNDRLGCLQDIHWFCGSFGYFPTYTLGAMAAAQLFAAARDAEPGLMEGIGHGDFAPMLRWLRINIHASGSLFSTDELLSKATGSPLDAQAYRAHLRARYLG